MTNENPSAVWAERIDAMKTLPVLQARAHVKDLEQYTGHALREANADTNRNTIAAAIAALNGAADALTALSARLPEAQA